MDSARFIDWMEESKNNFERWENHGRMVAEDACDHKSQDKDRKDPETNLRYSGWCEECELYEDSCQPMMNYGYPLQHLPTDEEILKVVRDTCLTIMVNTETDECFLVLCGGGMDLSQSIALAYLRAGERIPDDLVLEVYTQPKLSVNAAEYEEIMNACLEELEVLSARVQYRREEIGRRLKELREEAKE